MDTNAALAEFLRAPMSMRQQHLERDPFLDFGAWNDRLTLKIGAYQKHKLGIAV